jgi:hypothetical protein
MITVSEQWMTQSERVLKAMERSLQNKDKDRLEAITAILHVLNAVDQSLHGWRRWVQNLGFMAEFSADELRQMEQGLTKVGQAFIEYDLDVTKRYQDKIPQIRFRERPRQPTADSSLMVA